MKRIVLMIVAVLTMSSAFAMAAPEKKFSTLGTYFGIAQGWVEVEENNLNNEFEMYTFDLIGGATFHPNMGIEGRLGFGGSDRSGSKSYSLDHYFSLYFKPQYTFGRLNTYALIGASHVSSETSQTICGVFCFQSKNENSEFSLSYGAGAIYYFDRLMLGLEYVKVLDKDRVDIDRGGLLFGFVF
ncbi:outer membrane beta-barrel protein [Alkalimarinus coralli]|uniref:outer membrane beta-barrel protein n=1 Tax=Alkalimarinus coralli TaxID=2935863 RepID=UPI00202B8DCF|nr:outer membrane beta-barrel protein [Alkalimarinus coralli]